MPKFLDKLFSKKPASLEELQARLTEEQGRNDWPALARTYFAMGQQYMDRGDPARAMLYFSRCDTIFSARDTTYSQTDEKLMDSCSDRIGELEEAATLSNQVLEEVGDKAEELEDGQVRLWGLLTLARFVKLGERLAALPGCDLLDSMGTLVDLVARSLYEPLPPEDARYLHTFCDLIYTMSDSESYTDLRQQVEVPGRAPLQFFDLAGLLTLTEMNLYLDSQLTRLVEGGSDAEADFIPCALLPDYYLRTTEGDIRDLPQVRAELERIRSDYDFVAAGPDRAAVEARVAAYKELDILA